LLLAVNSSSRIFYVNEWNIICRFSDGGRDLSAWCDEERLANHGATNIWREFRVGENIIVVIRVLYSIGSLHAFLILLIALVINEHDSGDFVHILKEGGSNEGEIIFLHLFTSHGLITKTEDESVGLNEWFMNVGLTVGEVMMRWFNVVEVANNSA
jgi:hypothetical protein